MQRFKEEKRERVKPFKKRSPSEAKTFKDICGLATDGHHNKDSWIMLNGARTVFIAKQRNGHPATQQIELSKKDFEKMIQWYLKKQPVYK